jgi:hypothetical protein
LFRGSREIAAKDIAGLFGYKPGTALRCFAGSARGFIEITDPAKKSRRYQLADVYAAIVDEMD